MKDFIAYLQDVGNSLDVFEKAVKESSSSLASLSYQVEKSKILSEAEKLKQLKKVKPAASKMVNLKSQKPKTTIAAYHDIPHDMVVIDLVVGWEVWTAKFTYEVFETGDIHALIVDAFNVPLGKYPEARKALMNWFDSNLATKPVYPSQSSSVGRNKAIDKFPGIHEVVKNPVSGIEDTLEAIIIDLNDGEKWTRDQIADWLETLDLDLRFNVKETD